MKHQMHRSAAELRVAFKSSIAVPLPLPTLLEKVQRLVEEVSRIAATSFGDKSVIGYHSLLAEMEDWYDKHQTNDHKPRLDPGIRDRKTKGDCSQFDRLGSAL